MFCNNKVFLSISDNSAIICLINRWLLLIVSSSLFLACGDTSHLKEVENLYLEIKKSHAPDKRVAVFDLGFSHKSGIIAITGETNQVEAKEALLKVLQQQNIAYEDKVNLLPAKALGESTYGIINVSVCNIRSKKGHSQELATQSLLGTPIKVLDRQDNWYRVQTPDGYIAWLDHGGFVLTNENGYKEWISEPKVMYIKDYGFSYAQPDSEAQKVSDLVAGNMLKSIGVVGDFIKVQYPDKREAFIPKSEVLNYDTWLATRNPTAENIITTAQQYLGRPYLWGGTSGKGMDCSGFTKTVFYLNGIQLARDASQQVHTGASINTAEDLDNLQVGDLLFFGTKATKEKKERITHVGIYMGDGLFIHASGDAGVKIESLLPAADNFAEERLKTFVKARRIITSLRENGIDLLADLEMYNASEL